MYIKIPYGNSCLETILDEKRVTGVLQSNAHSYNIDEDEKNIVKEALQNPFASKRLCEIAEDKNKVIVITSDHTRPVPSKITLPILLSEIRKKNPDVSIKILIATGCHRSTSRNEMIEKFGEKLVENEEFINHDSTDEQHMVTKGKLPSGSMLKVNDLVEWADLIVSEGFIEPHFFAGFSGGRKSILPGITSQQTVMENHCSKHIDHDKASTGVLEGNPIHEDMVCAAKMADLEFILNVVIDGNKKVIKAFAGHPYKAHIAGCSFVQKMAAVDRKESDIVITSNGGYPLDRNIYQAVKGMTSGEACVKNGGVIIIAASCIDGHGGEEFYKWFAESKDPEAVYEKILSISQQDTIADQWQAQILARVMLKAKVIVVAEPTNRHIIENMKMKYAATIEDALQYAQQFLGYEGNITVIPDGVGVIVDT